MSVFQRHAQHFLHRRRTVEDLSLTIFPDTGRNPPGVAGQFLLADPIVDQLANSIVYHHKFIDAGTAPETGWAAGLTSHRLIDNGRLFLQKLQLRCICRALLAAFRR